MRLFLWDLKISAHLASCLLSCDHVFSSDLLRGFSGDLGGHSLSPPPFTPLSFARKRLTSPWFDVYCFALGLSSVKVQYRQGENILKCVDLSELTEP